MDYAGLLKEFKGYEGWGQSEALADYNKTGGAGKERRGASTGSGYSGSSLTAQFTVFIFKDKIST